MSENSPLDELEPPTIDDIWEKLSNGDRPSKADLRRLIEHQRAARAAFLRKEEAKED